MSLLDTAPSTHIMPRRLAYADAYSYFLLFLFLVPTFTGVLRPSGGLYVGEMLQILYTGAFFLLLVALMAHRRILKLPLLAAGLLCAIFIILIGLAILRDAHRAAVSDLLEIHKPLFAFIVFSATLLISWDDRAIRKIADAYVAAVAVMGIYSLFEALGGQSAHQVSSILYRGDRAILVGKATGTFGVTYLHASFMIFGALLSSALFLYLRKIRYLLVATLALMAAILSQSRAAAIAVLAMFLCIYLSYWAYSNFKHKRIFYVVGAIFVLVVYVAIDRILPIFENLPYLYRGIEYFLERGVDAEGQGSFSVRYQQILFAIESQDTIPLIGVGIGKDYARLLESYYALYLYRYGGIGIALSLLMFAAFFFLSLKAFNRAVAAGQFKSASFFIALHLWMYALPVLSLSTAIQDQGKLMVFFYGAIAIVVVYNHQPVIYPASYMKLVGHHIASRKLASRKSIDPEIYTQ